MTGLPDVPPCPAGMSTFLHALRSAVQNTTAAVGTWSALSGKPSTFPPSAHTHVYTDITNFGDGVGASLAQGSGITLSTAAGVTTITSAASSFIQGGTGAVIRTSQNKDRETISVADFKSGANSWADAASKAAVYAATQGNGASVYFPPGDYTGLSTVTDAAIWRIDGAAKFPSQSQTGPTGYKVTQYPFTNAASMIIEERTNPNSPGLRVGLPTCFIEGNLREFSIGIATIGSEARGGIAVHGSSQSSYGFGGSQGTIGLSGYGINDATSFSNGAWGGYFEGVKFSGALGEAIGIEINAVNFKNSLVDLTPNGGSGGFTPALILASGGGYVSSAGRTTYDASAAMVILANGSSFLRGIVIQQGSLRSGYGVGFRDEAISLYHNMQISWYNGSTAGAARIEAYAVSGAQFGMSILTNNSGGIPCGINIGTTNNSITAYNGDNTIALGAVGNAWSNVYSYFYPAVSDGRLKTPPEQLSNKLFAAAEAVDIVGFKFLAGNGRKNVGVIAQQVVAAFASQGLDATEYGVVYCEDDHYYVNYDALAMLMLAALRAKGAA